MIPCAPSQIDTLDRLDQVGFNHTTTCSVRPSDSPHEHVEQHVGVASGARGAFFADFHFQFNSHIGDCCQCTAFSLITLCEHSSDAIFRHVAESHRGPKE